MNTAKPWRPILAGRCLLLLASVLLYGCSEPPQVSRPLGVPFQVPTHLRECARQYGLTNPSAFLTRSDLMIGYGQERGAHIGVSACLEELIRLADVHNAKMKEIGGP